MISQILIIWQKRWVKEWDRRLKESFIGTVRCLLQKGQTKESRTRTVLILPELHESCADERVIECHPEDIVVLQKICRKANGYKY